MTYTRREFSKTILKAAAGIAVSGPMLSSLGCASRRYPKTDRTIPRVLADLHIHVDINDWNKNTPLGIENPLLTYVADKFVNKTGLDWKKSHEAGVDLICASHFNVFDEWLSMPTDPNPHAPANTHRMMDRLEQKLRGPIEPYARLVKNSGEMKRSLAIPKTDPDYRITVVHTVEGGHALGGDLGALESMAKRGLAMLTLTHFFNKGIASAGNSFPFFPDANSDWPNQGLSEFGREVIQEMENLGIIVDVIHSTPTAMEDIFEASTKPLVSSHSAARTLSDHPLSLIDEHIQEIAHRNGIIGVIIDPYLLSNYATLTQAETKATLSDVVRNIRYLVKMCGSHKNVGIGSDFAGFITGPTDMLHISQVGRLRAMLLDEFGDERIVNDIMANNVIEFLIKNWHSGV